MFRFRSFSPWTPLFLTGVTWELADNEGKHTLIKTSTGEDSIDQVDLPSPEKKYSIETNSDGVSYLKDGDKFLKSCDDTMHEILKGNSVETGLINQK